MRDAIIYISVREGFSDRVSLKASRTEPKISGSEVSQAEESER